MSTTIRCPHCQVKVAIPPSKTGRFRLRCPKCSGSFGVMVPEGDQASPVVEPLGATPNLPGPSATPDAAVTQVFPQSVETLEGIRPEPGTADPTFQPPRWLGGYRIGPPLGPTRSGASFRGWRFSTGRELALAVVRPRWAVEPIFVARFAREAFAAGKLDHPNLISPVDFDIARGYAFVASDALDGLALGESGGREGFDRTTRVAAILQAARGLQHAHEQGIYHRDLSLGKIRGDASGLIRLADLGVGLTPETPEGAAVTPIPMAGSPPLASPELLSAGFVREDIVGLGRALYSLVGGERGDRALPPGLASLIRRMLGEGLEGSFPDMGAVVRALEAELGVVGPFLPRDDEAAEIEACAQEFESAPLARLRPMFSAVPAVVLGLFAALTLLANRPLLALGAVVFGGIVATATVVVRGVTGRDPLFERAREWLLGGGRGDWLTVLAVVVLVVAVLAATGWLGSWIFLSLLAAGLATARHFALDRPIEQARAGPIGRATSLIRALRRQGVAEDSIRRFVCQQLGARWEELFEALFGYKALRSARDRWGFDAGGKRRPRFARWRDPILDAMDAGLEGRREARDLELFQALEERDLEARGVNLMTARRKSSRIAEAIVVLGRKYRRSGGTGVGLPLREALDRVALRPDVYLEAAESDEESAPAFDGREALGRVGRLVFGPRVRFLLGGVLLAGSLLWMHQNALISAEEIKQVGVGATVDREKAVSDVQEIGRKIAANVQGVADAATETRALEVAGLSPSVSTRLDGFGLGVAGLILIASSLFQGARMAAFAVPGALVAALGPRLIEPAARPLGPTSLMAMAIGVGLFAAGLVFGRSRD